MGSDRMITASMSNKAISESKENLDKEVKIFTKEEIEQEQSKIKPPTITPDMERKRKLKELRKKKNPRKTTRADEGYRWT